MAAYCPECLAAIDTLELPSGSDLVCPACGRSFRVELNSTIAKTVFQAESAEPGQRVVSQQQLGRFVLFEVVGSGGFGEVYRAYDSALKRVVAIKVPNERILRRPDLLRRVQREARSAGQLHHSAIVAVLDWGESNGLPYIVYEFVDGTTLAGYIRRTPLDFRQVAQLVRDIARGLHYAHQRGIIHRDVKPGNILIDRSPESTDDIEQSDTAIRARLTDFGLAKLDDQELTNISVVGDVMGTLAYMSPEQARGEIDRLDHRSDVYSLGATLYELLCGTPPFTGTQAEVIEKVASRTIDVGSVSRVNTDVPVDLSAICNKALEKEEGRRYQSAGKLAEDLDRWLHHRPVKARQAGPVGRAVRWCRRNRSVAASAAIVFATLLIATIISSRLYLDSLKSLQQYRTQLSRWYVQKANSYPDEDVMLALPWMAAAAKLDEDDPGRLAIDTVALHSGLAQCARLTCEQSHAGEIAAADADSSGRRLVTVNQEGLVTLWDFTKPCASSQAWQFEHAPGACRLSADGRFVAMNERNGKTCVRNVATGAQVAEWSHQSGDNAETDAVLVKSLRFQPLTDPASADRLIAAAELNRNRASLWNVLTGQLMAHLNHDGFVHQAVFDDEGQSLLTVSSDHTAKLWDLPLDGTATDEVAPVRTFHHPSAVVNVLFCPGGREFVTSCIDGSVHVWDRDSDEPVFENLLERGAGAATYQFSSDGAYLVVSRGSPRSSTMIWDVERLEQVGETIAGNSAVTAMAFSEDATVFALGHIDGTVDVIRIVDGDHQRIVPTIHHRQLVKTVALGSVDPLTGTPEVMVCLRNGDVRCWRCVSWHGATADIALESIEDLQPGGRPHSWLIRGTSKSPLVMLTGQGSELAALEVSPRRGDKSLQQTHVFSAAVSPDGTKLATGGLSATSASERRSSIVLWETESRARTGVSLSVPEGFIPRSTIAFDSTSRYVMAESSANDGRRAIQVWQVSDGEELYHQVAKAAYARWTQRPHLLAVKEGSSVTLLDPTSSDSVVAAFEHSGVVHQVVCPESTDSLVTRSGTGSLRRWSMASMTEAGSSAASSVPGSITNANAHVFTVRNSRSVSVFSLSDGLPLRTTVSTEHPLRGTQLSPDGELMLTIELGGRAILWGTHSGDRVARVGRWPSQVERACFAEDSRSILLVGRRRDHLGNRVTATLWPLESASSRLPDLTSRLSAVAGLRVNEQGVLREVARQRAGR